MATKAARLRDAARHVPPELIPLRQPPFQRRTSNVLIIGAGAAGTRAAIAARQAGADVVIVSRRPRGDAHTVLAAGGINAVLGTVDPQDSAEQHFVDTMREGHDLADPRAVELLAREAPGAILELAGWGCPFERKADGRLDQRFFGAHSYRRTCYAGDHVGRAVLDTLWHVARQLGVPVIEGLYVTRLLVHDGRCFGALAFDLRTGERWVLEADAVVLATGGHTRIWRRSSSRRDENYGEGMWLALQSGGRLRDMELVQFHPTGMVWPEEASGTLVTEAVRAEGGRLFNAQGERFMERYDPERLELSARDRVALANYTEISEGRSSPNGGVFLDVRHLGKETILARLPRVYRQFVELEMLDISREPMEVAPTAHYSMGGIEVEPETHATCVDGLYAAGECTAGLHGANRLGGNSLTETVVFGRRAGEAAAAFSVAQSARYRSQAVIEAALEDVDEVTRKGPELGRRLQREIREIMWRSCGVLRDAAGLEQGLAAVEDVASRVPDVDVRPSDEGWWDLAHVFDLRAMVGTARATLLGALARRETRGAHIRADYPGLEAGLRLNFVFTLEPDGALVVTRRPLPPPHDDLSWDEAA